MKKIAFTLAFLLVLSGCATYKPVPSHVIAPPVGIYHEVRKGETLWRISRAYGVDWRKILEANHIQNPKEIRPGDRLFIPGAKEEKVVPPLSFFSKEENFTWPAKGRIIHYFGKGKGKNARGIDISVPIGTEIKAARSGKIVFAGPKRGFGELIIIDHGNGYATVYAHNSRLLVKEGDYVRQGEVIALSGDWGNCEEPMLHFEIREGNEPKNPLDYLP